MKTNDFFQSPARLGMKGKKSRALLFLIILVTQFLILNLPVLLDSSGLPNKSSDLSRENSSTHIVQEPLLANNITPNSLEVIAGNAIYSDLVLNPDFTSQNNWSYTNSSNLTAEWDSTKEKAKIHHESNPSPDFFIGYTTNLVQSVNLILFNNPLNTYLETRIWDGLVYQINEGGTNPYNINVEFILNSSMRYVNRLQISLYGRYSGSGDSFSWQVYNNLNSQWDLLNTIASTSNQWYNSSITQDPLGVQYKTAQGIIRLRIYDADGSDGARNTLYFDYIGIRTNGTSGTLKELDQIALINQTLVKGFNTKASEETQSNKVTILSETFESGSFSSNGWNSYRGGGILEISSINPYSGIYCAHFSGNSLSNESILSKILSLSGLFNASLTYFIRIDSLEPTDFLALDIYDGSWHYNVKSYTGTSAYQPVTVDLTNYNLIDGFQIAFRGNMSSSTGDSVYLDNVVVSGFYASVPPVLLNFSYSVEQSSYIKLLELHVRLSNSSNFSQLLWRAQVIQLGQSGKKISLDISNKLRGTGTYNISFEVHTQISTIYRINFSVNFDEIYVISQNITSLYYLTSKKDDRVLTFYPVKGFLDIRFNFTIPQGNMTISIFSHALGAIVLQIFNFTSFTWVNITTIENLDFLWTNISNLADFHFMDSQTKTLIVRYINSTGSNLIKFLLDFQTLQVFQYPSRLNIIQVSSTDVTPGQVFRAQIIFTAPTVDPFIKGALIVTNYTEDQFLVHEIQNGIYNITFYTDLGSPGQKFIQIVGSKEGYANGTAVINFTLSGFISELRFVTGAKLVEGVYWLENPPFPDDHTKEIQIYFNGSFGGLDGGLIQARLNITEKLMSFKDLGNIISHEYDGYYNITVDTAGLHDGQVGLIDIKAVAEGYLTPKLNITFQVIKIPVSYLSLETDVNNITTIEGSIIRIGASFKELFHDQVLFNSPIEGNLTWKIDSPNGTYGHQMEPFFTIYFEEIRLSDYNITPGTYKITIETWASRDYENIKKNISLVVLPKQQVNLNFLNLPSYVLAGTQFKVYINLTDSLDSPFTSTALNFRLLYEPGPLESQEIRITNNFGIGELLIEAISIMRTIQIEVEYSGDANFQSKMIASPKIDILKLNSSLTLSQFPDELIENQEHLFSAELLVNGTTSADKIVTFLFSYEGSGRTDIRTAATNSLGIATVPLTIPSGITRLYLTVSYNGISYETSTTVEGEVPVVSFLTIFWRQSWIFFSILAIGIIIGVAYIINKKIIHFTPLQKEIRKLKGAITKKGKLEKVKRISREMMLLDMFNTELSKIKIPVSKKNNR